VEGWIKLHRKMINWEWYKDNNTKILFLHLILTANHSNQKWQGIEIKRGQKLTSAKHLAEETNLTIMQTRTSLKKLKSTHEITIKTTNKNTLITIEKYNDYQINELENNKQNSIQNNNSITNKQQTNNKQITTNKNDKNDKNDKNIYFNLLNKYKQLTKQTQYFGDKISAINKIKNEEDYLKLSIEKQKELFIEMMSIN
jgi:TusA-related sulfurtransferase